MLIKRALNTQRKEEILETGRKATLTHMHLYHIQILDAIFSSSAFFMYMGMMNTHGRKIVFFRTFPVYILANIHNLEQCYHHTN